MSHAPGVNIDVPLIDLAAQRAQLGDRINTAIERVLAHGQFILGPEVGELETRLSALVGVRHAVSCGSGTDALLLALMAHGIGQGDAVFVPDFSFPAPVEAIVLTGAAPVFVDVDEAHGLLDPASLEAAAQHLSGLRPRGVIAVDLYGHPADYDAIRCVARKWDMVVIADAAQSFGATCGDAWTGSLADVTTTSFYPSKPLGCYGDGGCVFTASDAIAAALRTLRVHGQEAGGRLTRVGLNARLDTLQAAILLEKLALVEVERAARQRIAARYNEALGDIVDAPETAANCRHAWACYTVRSSRRDAIEHALRRSGIATAVHYRTPLHRQPAYRDALVAPGGAPVAERLAGEVLSLPMHPYLDEATQDMVVDHIRTVAGQRASACVASANRMEI